MIKYIMTGFAVLAMTASLISHAAEINSNNYDIYIGDLNNDGLKDFYFHGKESNQIVVGGGPLLIAAPPTFAIYREANTYSTASFFLLTDTQIISYLLQGKFRKAITSDTNLSAGVDVLFWRDDINGFTNVFLRGADASSPALLLASTSQDLPLVAATYDHLPGNPNLSDPTLEFSLIDINSDGRRDLTNNGRVYLSNFSGLLSERSYTSDQMSSGPVVEDYFYDDLGRLQRVESSDGGIQIYQHDREDNRSLVSRTKSIQ